MRRRAIAALLLTVGCGSCAPGYGEELWRITSPGGEWDAVVATVARGEHAGRTAVVVVPAREPIRREHPAFVADCLSGLTLEWLDARSLVIGVDKARIWEYDDLVWQYDADGKSRTVGVALRSKSERLLGECAPRE
jgi:hypothetical protein